MVTLMVTGAACIPLLTVQYSPTPNSQSLTVVFSYSAPARVVETQVTSALEGIMNTVQGVCDIQACSRRNAGYVTLTFKDGTDMETARADVLMRLRQIHGKLPRGTMCFLGGPVGGSGRSRNVILSYTINADMPRADIVRYADEHIVPALARVEGVDNVGTSGATPYEWVLAFDPDVTAAAGTDAGRMASALNEYSRNSIVGTLARGDSLTLVRLKSKGLKGRLEDIAIGMSGGRLLRIGDFAKATYREQPPDSYYRINGLNTIDLYIEACQGVNTLTVADAVKQRMGELEKRFPAGFAMRPDYDASQELGSGIRRIFMRAALSLVLLLLSVLLVSRSFKYLLVIGLTVCANMLVAVIFYRLLDIDMEMYSMAGITVSLGIVIDTAIVIADHYSYYGNRRVLTSVAGALLTTVAALLTVFFLPETDRSNLGGFIRVTVINLSLSMVCALLFVPALLDRMTLESGGVVRNDMKRLRRTRLWTVRYTRLSRWGMRHRKFYITATVLLFGLPFHLLPPELQHKTWLEYPLGGTLGIYHRLGRNGTGQDGHNDTAHENILHVYADMPQGSSTAQLDGVVREVENWLQQFDEISLFQTGVNGTQATIDIHFKDECRGTRFPYSFKENLWQKLMERGSVTWSIPPLDKDDRHLSNGVNRTAWSNTIQLYGYSYDLLFRYAGGLIDSLKANRRVSDAGFSRGYGSFVDSEFCLEYDMEKAALAGTGANSYRSYLEEQLFDGYAGSVAGSSGPIPVRLRSTRSDSLDLWHILNGTAQIEGRSARLGNVGSLTKRRTAMDIERSNREYVISVGFEFTGPEDMKYDMLQKRMEQLEKDLPTGFRAGYSGRYGSWGADSRRAALILAVILAIFMILAALFESLRHALTIVSLIPVSFIGLFTTYSILGLPFNQGAFAAMVMLSGITVNAGIYLTSEYRTICAGRHSIQPGQGLRLYVRAWNRKIVPTMLTIASTVLGLVPFLFDGHQDMFWFSFAAGVIGGMLFSVLGITVVMPAFFPLGRTESLFLK